MIPKHYSLVKENPDSYTIHDKRDDRRFDIAKKGLDLPMHTELGKIQHFSEGTPDKPVQADNTIDYSKADWANQPTPEDAPYGSGAPNLQLAAADRIPQSIPDASPSPGNLQSPATVSVDAPQAGSPDPIAQQTFDSNAALQTERNSLESGVSAAGGEGARTAAAYREYADKLDDMPTPQEIYQNHKEADDALMKAYNEKSLDPEHYWNSKGTGSKIAAGLGMILGGAGSALAGQPNFAMDVINKAIDRDMEAQKNDQSKTLNLWKMNREATKDETQANLATQNQMLNGVKARAIQFASEAAGPQAKARLAPTIMQIDQQMNMNNFRRAMLSAGQQRPGQPIQADPSMMLGMMPEKDQPVAAKEIANAQEIKKLKDDFQGSFNDLNAKALGGALSPSDRQSAINAFAGRIAKLSEGRFNLQEAGLQAEALLPNWKDMGDTRARKQERVNQFFDSMVTAPVFKGATGMDLNRFASTNTKSAPAPQTATKDGQTYVKVPGGWQKVNPQVANGR